MVRDSPSDADFNVYYGFHLHQNILQSQTEQQKPSKRNGKNVSFIAKVINNEKLTVKRSLIFLVTD